MATETIRKNSISKYLSTLKECWFMKVLGTVRGRTGVPDIICVYKGTPIFLEVKTDKGTASPKQLIEIDKLRKAKAIVEIVRTRDDVKRIIEKVERGK